MTTGARLYGASDAAKSTIVRLEVALHEAIQGQGDAGLQLCALINQVLDRLDAAPPEAREFYLEQINLCLGANYEGVAEDEEPVRTLAERKLS